MARQKVEITCDACGYGFTLDDKDIKMRMTGEVLFRYFKCPSCDSAFMVSASNKEFRKLLNSHRADRGVLRVIQGELNKQYFPKFKELFPTAYRKDDETNEDQ